MQFSLLYAQSFQPSQCQVAQALSNKLTYILNFSIVTSPSPHSGEGDYFCCMSSAVYFSDFSLKRVKTKWYYKCCIRIFIIFAQNT